MIGKVEVVELREKNGATKLKRVVWFNGATKALVVNKTNAKKLADVSARRPPIGSASVWSSTPKTRRSARASECVRYESRRHPEVRILR